MTDLKDITNLTAGVTLGLERMAALQATYDMVAMGGGKPSLEWQDELGRWAIWADWGAGGEEIIGSGTTIAEAIKEGQELMIEDYRVRNGLPEVDEVAPTEPPVAQ